MAALTKKRTFPLIICLLTCLLSCSIYAEEEKEPKVPRDFLRDVMQPMGVPVVSSYHAMRENLFLNTKISKAHPLESIGNFFLAPSQYLFAGKKIIIKDPETYDYEVVQTFKYQRFHWLKTLGAIIALPFSEVLGASFKGLAYLSPSVRKRHKMLKQALRSSLIKSQLEVYRKKGLTKFHCDEFIPCQNFPRPSGLTKKQKVELQALQDVITLFDAHNIVYWIDCGTCLGAYRHGGIIPWDWDVDISIFLHDHDNVKKLLSQLDPAKYQIQDWSSYSKPKTFLKLYVKETKNFVDIYHYQINEKEHTVRFVFTYLDSPFPESWKKAELKCMKPLKYEDVFPLKKAKFDHLTVRAPNNVVGFLQSKYGKNLEPAMIWDEATKSYKKTEKHPYYD